MILVLKYKYILHSICSAYVLRKYTYKIINIFVEVKFIKKKI